LLGDDFINTRLVLDVDEMVPKPSATPWSAPGSVHLYGDRVPVDYEWSRDRVVRLRLKEGQAPPAAARSAPLDRPIRFTVLRGKRETVRSDTLEDLRRQLTGLTRGERHRLIRAAAGRAARCTLRAVTSQGCAVFTNGRCL